MNIAYWISPRGEIIDVRTKHITEIITNPEKFGLNREFIEHVHAFYKEKIGTEGKAREQIMLSLFNQGWIRLRRYKNFWSVNVKKLAGKTKDFVSQWAKIIIKGYHGFQEHDYRIDVKIDQKGKKIKTVELQDIAASNKFISEYKLVYKTIDELPDLEPYDFVNETIKRKTFKDYLKENID